MMMIQGRELLVEEGVRVEITCQAQGRPQPEVIVIVILGDDLYDEDKDGEISV